MNWTTRLRVSTGRRIASSEVDATDSWIETKANVDQVLDDGRKINQAVARGNYGSDVARLWRLYGPA